VNKTNVKCYKWRVEGDSLKHFADLVIITQIKLSKQGNAFYFLYMLSNFFTSYNTVLNIFL